VDFPTSENPPSEVDSKPLEVQPPLPPSPKTVRGALRPRRLTKAQIDARVGSGPETPEPTYCAICAHTKAFHKMLSANKLRHDPKWVEHIFVELLETSGLAAVGGSRR
jgi:hypothetical protein